ncbi:MAG TPA: membrane protein insertase YidC [Bacteroidales bacterium]|nr:membrane protein insertase YidC [Bacteroidales bacterium]
MNRNTIIGLVMIFAIMIGYSLLTRPSKEELARRQRIQDSLMIVQQSRLDSLALADSLRKSTAIPLQVNDTALPAGQPAVSALEQSALHDALGIFSAAATGTQKIYFIENELIRLGISSKGGKVVYAELKDYKTYDTLPLVLYDSSSVTFGLTFFANNRLINTDELYFQPYWSDAGTSGNETMSVSGSGSLTFAMRLYTNGTDSLSSFSPSNYVEYVYTLSGKDYMVDFAVHFTGLKGVLASNTEYLDLTWNADLMQQERSIDRYNGPTIYYKHSDGEVNYLSETKDDQEEVPTRLQWISFKQRFFCSTIISDDNFVSGIVNTYTDKQPRERYERSMESRFGVPFSDKERTSMDMKIYYGPLKYSILRDYKLDLERQIPMGWSFFLMQWINRFAVIPVFNFLSGFGWNYGIIILVLTILLKIVLLPIAYKTYMSTAKMRVLRPDVEEINKKYPKKEDAMKKQQATMDLYKRAGVNPMAGCVPMLLQFPILIALFRFFPSSIELRQQPFLWAHDLSSYDSILNLPFTIPFYGDHVSLFCLLMTISTIVYTKINNDMMSTGQQQIAGMKTISYIMPIMFLGFFNAYASALSYYYLLANLLTFLQMYLFRRLVDEKKIHARIEENKKRPVKKSGFQKRLEDMAKQRGYPVKR